MRKVEVDIQDLIDIMYAGKDGELDEYYIDFLKNDVGITKEDILEYAKFYKSKQAKKQGYSMEDYDACVDFAEDWGR